jgi:methylated-DNA-protein-cysteine methyltransferase related protein
MVREASGDERRGAARRDAGAPRWTAEDEREAARWLGRDDAAPDGDAAPPRDRRDAVLARVRATPRGFVRTYGDVSPGAPRFAGTVLHGTHDPDLPWFRIVRADGSLTQGMRQRKLLEAEGVPFRGDKVDMRAARVP